ncbi:predicted protein [Uncinocarpus reesii 1704]|uniref:Uncharacterized protein n=1 Tax=Uncinocarpus reesii (strain UAMH 1704) TaxID=336963 RepID=C4JUS0_UNCRE|nr:uncharacterized protein UREG_04873 [Uncinocarpus reesii 1704]EEP80031.1 predicted protein [Uncinocarpus reesii 1704]
MPIREKIKRVFSRTSAASSSSSPSSSITTPAPQRSKPKTTTVVLAGVKTVKVKPRLGKDGKPKIEIYKPHEVPRSKYRGPFDQDHLRSLAAYSIPTAMSDRPRSMVSELSPMGTWAPPTRRNSLVRHEAVAKKMIDGLTQALEEMERQVDSPSEEGEENMRFSCRDTRGLNTPADGTSPEVPYFANTKGNVSSSTLLSLRTLHIEDTQTLLSSCDERGMTILNDGRCKAGLIN